MAARPDRLVSQDMAPLMVKANESALRVKSIALGVPGSPGEPGMPGMDGTMFASGNSYGGDGCQVWNFISA